MKGANPNQHARYPKGALAPIVISYISIKNPQIVMWWSAALPGFGHILLCKYIQGGLLIVWEFFINFKSNLNQAIFYSLTGQFEQAKQALDSRWFLLYIVVYLFGMWDARRCAVDLNQFAILANRQGSTVEPLKISALEVEFLAHKKPWIATMWSLLFPSLGQIYLNRLVTGFYIMIWWIIVSYFSNIVQAIHLTFYGDFAAAAHALNVHWALALPSIYGFSAYDAYFHAIEYTRLFKNQQEQYLKERYYQVGYLPTEGGSSMHVVASFEHSLYLELALSDLERRGITKAQIQALTLAKGSPEQKTTDLVLHGNESSMYDATFAFATAGMVLGGIYGFKLAWGPIIWGLLLMVIGVLTGYLFEKLRRRGRAKKHGDRGGEVIVLVRCEREQAPMVGQILNEHDALGIAHME